MITGRIRNHINAIWDAFWSGGISNPLEVIEQITFPRFLKWLNDLHRTAAGYGVSCELPHVVGRDSLEVGSVAVQEGVSKTRHPPAPRHPRGTLNHER
jgi:hypothetical protein